MTEQLRSEADAIAEISARAIGVRHVEKHPFIVTNEGIEDLEHLLPSPLRKKGKTVLTEADSFVRYVQTFSPGSTPSIYCNKESASFVAVLNEHEDDRAGWRDWLAYYTCTPSQEWLKWVRSSGHKMNQVDFAAFIEDNALDIRKPVAAEMLEISRSLDATKKVVFASGIRLSSGENELQYSESIEATAAKGKLKIPEEFSIAIPVFEGDDPYEVTARLRYRIGEDKKLAMWFDLIRPDVIRRDAVNRAVKSIEEGLGLKVLFGDPKV